MSVEENMLKPSLEAFGVKLKKLRETAKESIADVSGAVEIDTVELMNIEQGKLQPSEDIVLLLISHFALKEDEAMHMWQLAGYAQEQVGVAETSIGDKPTTQTAFITPGDARILYTDLVHVNANKHGVVINFLQGLGGQPNQNMTVSRIGMSREHAKSFLKVLKQTLELSEHKPKRNTK